MSEILTQTPDQKEALAERLTSNRALIEKLQNYKDAKELNDITKVFLRQFFGAESLASISQEQEKAEKFMKNEDIDNAKAAYANMRRMLREAFPHNIPDTDEVDGQWEKIAAQFAVAWTIRMKRQPTFAAFEKAHSEALKKMSDKILWQKALAALGEVRQGIDNVRFNRIQSQLKEFDLSATEEDVQNVKNGMLRIVGIQEQHVLQALVK